MPIMTDADRNAVRGRLEESLKADVTIKLFTESPVRTLLTIPGRPATDCLYCKETQQLMEELVELSPRLKLQVYNVDGDGAQEAKALGVEHIPAIVFGDGPTHGRVKYYGIPLGFEFVTLLEGIEALSTVAQGESPSSLPPQVAQAAKELIQEPVHLRVFVTPT